MNDAQRQLIFDYSLERDVSAAYAALKLELITSDDLIEVIRRRPSNEIIADVIRLGPVSLVQDLSQLPLHLIQEEVIKATINKIGFGKLAVTDVLDRDNIPLETEVALHVTLAFWDNNRKGLKILEDRWSDLADFSCMKVISDSLLRSSQTEKIAIKTLKIIRKLNRRSPKDEVPPIVVQLKSLYE